MLCTSLFLALFLFLKASNIDGGQIISSHRKGQLLTPEEGCGISKVANTKIVGGTTAKPGAWPWIVAVGRQDGDDLKFKCGGSLITSRHVLTAGHCTKNVNVVRLGAHVRYSLGTGPHRDVEVIHVENHPEYNTTESDVGILYLAHDVKFADHILPVCLPINESIRKRNFVGRTPFVAGWGLTSDSGRPSIALRQLQVPVLENRLCNKLYAAQDVDGDFDERVICAGNLSGGDGICSGDSGGPLMLPIFQNGTFPFYQIGVVTFSLDCGRSLSPDGYASIPYHFDWIQKMVNKEI